MKYLLLGVLFLTACGPADFYNLIGKRRFAIGDCLVTGIHKPEKWEKHKPQYIVTDIGQKSYRIKFIEVGDSDIYDNVTFGHLWEDFYQKVDCK